jgi:hypothetical protein
MAARAMKRTPLSRSTPIKRHPHKDPVTPALRLAVLERDGGCVAWRVEQLTEPRSTPCGGRLTLDHVQDGYGRMGKRAPSDMDHLVTLCYNHHQGPGGWATSHRPELRAYLREQAERTGVVYLTQGPIE